MLTWNTQPGTLWPALIAQGSRLFILIKEFSAAHPVQFRVLFRGQRVPDYVRLRLLNQAGDTIHVAFQSDVSRRIVACLFIEKSANLEWF